MEASEYSNPPHSVSKQNIEVFTLDYIQLYKRMNNQLISERVFEFHNALKFILKMEPKAMCLKIKQKVL